jgi:hypothetical protein
MGGDYDHIQGGRRAITCIFWRSKIGLKLSTTKHKKYHMGESKQN